MFPPTFPHQLSIFGAPKVELDSTQDRDSVIQVTGPAYVLAQHPRPYAVKVLWIHARYFCASLLHPTLTGTQ